MAKAGQDATAKWYQEDMGARITAESMESKVIAAIAMEKGAKGGINNNNTLLNVGTDDEEEAESPDNNNDDDGDGNGKPNHEEETPRITL